MIFSKIFNQISSRDLTIHDETPGGSIIHQVKIRLSRTQITVKELIKERVYQEVAAFNVNSPAHYFGILAPETAQREWFGYRIRKRTKIDPFVQYHRTLTAFENNQLGIFVNDKKLDDPNVSIMLDESIKVSFMQFSEQNPTS